MEKEKCNHENFKSVTSIAVGNPLKSISKWEVKSCLDCKESFVVKEEGKFSNSK